ncbi:MULTISPECIES: 2-hydroxyacid dehydrogenase [unclassified Coleofasciculus]|uniref:2-hydroxyacid dehydrogenase n=1 Tax=unclassified Coleofasciculus TaxID=2692782 RepID=UPI001881653C|nr:MULTISPECIES: 2-hydroxyacid dehydrogenase [unclassified Coleofasciculus]MBE9129265.1 2-hydroxyacid dehydrogenase [Coleofasciculus sp. LEGE 07081]MBE9147429.1 2-hydroxyacid dehydrogenase [Coleofasciculus sp. LEGE 07092]
MKVAVFSTKSYDQKFLEAANTHYNHELVFFEPRLTNDTAPLAAGFPAVCVFINDELNQKTLQVLAAEGTKLIATRSAGFNQVDLNAANQLGMSVVRVPAYSPYAVAEHTVGLILTLNRKIHRAYNRVRDGNFSLDGFIGFDLHSRTVGIIGTGKIGFIVAQILKGFGCQLLGYDVYPNADAEALGMKYVELPELFAASDIISLHCPLTPQTYHLINAQSLEQMKQGVMLINTSRGALIDTTAVIDALKSRQIGYLGLDVYEQESNLFFEDLSEEVIEDDVFQRLLTFPNVLITGHQAFFTEEALKNIADTTLSNITDVESGRPCPNEVRAKGVLKSK